MALNVCDSYEEVLRVFLSEVYPVCVGCNQALRSPEWRSQEQICLASDWLVDYQGKPIRGRKGAGHSEAGTPLVTSLIGSWTTISRPSAVVIFSYFSLA